MEFLWFILPLTMEALMRKRYTEEQIVKILQEGQGGKINEVCRRHGISEQTFFNWRNKFSGMGIPEIRRLRELESENGRLKRIIAERDLEIDAMREVLKKNW
jgi:putative transposase